MMPPDGLEKLKAFDAIYFGAVGTPDVPGDLDWVIVRENSEGEYAGCGGRVHGGPPEEVGSCDFHPRRPRANHALCVQASAVASARTPHRRHQVQRAASRHGEAARDCG
jgi:isocitrate/isopropylmalate dehydrogenase